MRVDGVIARVFENTLAYRLTQLLFVEQKLRPVLRSADFRGAHRVLDVACGPGTNTRYFQGKDYLGLDINPRYVDYARRRYGRTFEVADLTTHRFPFGYDLVLVNSFFHHLNDAQARDVLHRLRPALSDGGHIHVIDLLVPERPGPARLFSRLDRGHFARPLAEWRLLLGEAFRPVSIDTFTVGLFGVTLWNLVHFRGTAAR